MKDNKGLKITTYFFAVIGVIAVLTAIVFGVISLVNNVKLKQSEKKDVEASGENTIDEAILNEVIGEGQDTSSDAVNTDTQGLGEPSQVSDREGAKVLYGDGELTITFLGDSILDNFRDDTGICNIVANSLDATVYNLGIGGCSASEARGDNLNEPPEGTVSTQVSGAMLAEVMAGFHTFNCIFPCQAKIILEENLEEIKKSDIFVVEYGINDFRCGRDPVNMENLGDPTTYEGALRHIVGAIKSFNPEAAIILCEPSYTYYLRDDGSWIGDSDTLDGGLGTLVDYGGKTQYVATTLDTYLYMKDVQGIGYENRLTMLLDDGTHLNERGRRCYAQNLMEFMVRQGLIESYKWDDEDFKVDIDLPIEMRTYKQ